MVVTLAINIGIGIGCSKYIGTTYIGSMGLMESELMRKNLNKEKKYEKDKIIY